MKTKANSLPDIIPVFDRRDGADASGNGMEFKTWSELGLRWNSYREYSLQLNCNLRDGETFEGCLERLIAGVRAKGERIIAAAIHNFAVSLIVTA